MISTFQELRRPAHLQVFHFDLEKEDLMSRPPWGKLPRIGNYWFQTHVISTRIGACSKNTNLLEISQCSAADRRYIGLPSGDLLVLAICKIFTPKNFRRPNGWHLFWKDLRHHRFLAVSSIIERRRRKFCISMICYADFLFKNHPFWWKFVRKILQIRVPYVKILHMRPFSGWLYVKSFTYIYVKRSPLFGAHYRINRIGKL